MGEQPFTEKAITLQVYAQSSCWGTAADHPCQTNSTQKAMGPGLALLTPSFSWEKRPESKAEPPDERQIESETEVSAFTPGLLPHIKSHLRGQASVHEFSLVHGHGL